MLLLLHVRRMRRLLLRKNEMGSWRSVSEESLSGVKVLWMNEGGKEAGGAFEAPGGFWGKEEGKGGQWL